jgi:predicted RNA-binding Zn ribbon-like protein
MDPRPLIGEPISIDLLNTRWVSGGTAHDLLTSTDGLAVWLAAPTVEPELRERPVSADEETLDALRRARDALLAAADHADLAGINAVLARGRVRLGLTADGPDRAVEIDDPAWFPGWVAAENYRRLVGARPDRIRTCGGPGCVLHFFDDSRNGTRRWCSMAGCGNRAKAARHYARHSRG